MKMQYRPCVLCIYRTLIQQRLLVEFSCELPTLYPLGDLLACAIICHCNKWLPQQQNLTTLGNFALCELLTTYSYSSSTVSNELNVKKKHKLDPRRKGVYQSGRQSLTSRLHCCSHMYIGRITLCGRGSQIFSSRSLVLWCTVVAYTCRGAAQSIKEHLDQRFPAQGYQTGILLEQQLVRRQISSQQTVQVGQEECSLLPTENLLLFRIDSKRIKKDYSHWK